MPHYLLIGAGFTRNWGGPLSDEITGSLLGELHDDPQLAAALRRGPFEEAFQGFQTPTGSSEEVTRLRRFQNAVTELFLRLNRTLLLKQFEFNNDLEFSVKKFLARFDAISHSIRISFSKSNTCRRLFKSANGAAWSFRECKLRLHRMHPVQLIALCALGGQRRTSMPLPNFNPSTSYMVPATG